MQQSINMWHVSAACLMQRPWAKHTFDQVFWVFSTSRLQQIMSQCIACRAKLPDATATQIYTDLLHGTTAVLWGRTQKIVVCLTLLARITHFRHTHLQARRLLASKTKQQLESTCLATKGFHLEVLFPHR